jgi:hypothetical protein
MSAHVLNLYAITNADDLRARYRLVDISGTYGEDDLAEQNLNLLAKRVALEEKTPAALVRVGGKPILAVPADLRFTKTEYQLTPDVVEILPRDEEHELCLGNLTPETESLGLSFLSFHLRNPLFHNPDLWSSSPWTYFAKCQANYRENRREVDIYEGFSFRVIRLNGKLFLSISLTNKYSDSRWLLDRYAAAELPRLKMRHMLYHTGHRWFPVQLLSLTGASIADQKFVLDDKTTRTVYEHTILVAGEHPPQWIQSLSPDSPAITYQYPGNEKKHHGAAALCKLLLSTDDDATRKLHRHSIIPPDARFRATADILRQNFFGTEFEGVALRFESRALRTKAKHFPVPAQRFGQGKVLSPEEVGLEKLGNTRMGYLLDPQGGLAVHSPLGAQFIFVPDTLDRKIAQPFQDGLENTMRSFLHTPYQFRPVVYANDKKRTLKDQVDAILEAAQQNGGLSGHGILVLPENAAPDLHNYIKKRLHSQIQFQCVSAGKVRSFYKLVPTKGKAQYVVDRELERNYTSYLRYTALGLLLVNHRWPWVLDQPMHFDAYIGVDVLRNTAAFTFFYEGGRKCFVRLEESPQKEKVPRKKVAAIVYRYLKEDLHGNPRRLRSLVFRRDGRAFSEECHGFRDAVSKLIQEGVLQRDIKPGVVEVHKTFAPGLRLVAEETGRLVNPRIGSWQELNDRDAILCTTGYPFRFDGTVKPLYLRLVWGELELAKVLEDTFAMSQLCWPVPNRCMRLSIDLKLCDDLLRATAGDADEEEAIYGEDEPVMGEESELEVPFLHYRINP